MADYTIKKGDRNPSVEATLRRNGAAINLTGWTVNFVMRPKNGGPVKVNAACVLVTAASGIVRYDWLAADTDTVGIYHAEFKIIIAAGNFMTCPNSGHLTVEILGDLD